MRLTRSTGVLAASLVAVALAASACSSSKSTTAPAKQVAATQEQINAQPVSSLQQGGTLNLSMEQWSSQWNIFSANGNVDADTQTVISALLPAPYHYSADGTPTYNADYLTGEPVSSTVGGKQTVTYELNPKAVWSDGTPITYKDYVANWQALNGKTANYNPTFSVGYDQIASVAEGKNADEVVVTYSSPFSDWKSLFAPLYPASEYATADDFNKNLLTSLGLSGGPFEQGSVNQTDQTVTLVPNPKWWGSKPVLDSIVFKTISTDATAQAFANGEIDSFDIGVDATAYKTAKSTKNATVLQAGGPDYRALTINAQSANLSDVQVRQAVSEALDRTAIAKSDLAGLPASQILVNNHFYMPNQKGYTNTSGAVGTYSASAAEQLLNAAGWTLPAGGTYRTKAGKELDLTLLIPSDVSVATNESTLITAMLKTIGIKVTTTSEGDPFFTDIAAGKFDLTVFTWEGTNYPISSSISLYQNIQSGNWGQNYARIGSSTIDSEMNTAAGQTNPTTATADINQADQAIWQEAGVIPFYQRPELEGQVKTLANYGAFGFADIVWQNIGFTK
ncbi:ABC transporter family substrate-binding protein [Actinospica durhamensis]|uniref:ABC transporter family substrate-binding protein n=1 Tax=Actinospica durhamensis TaxID=1508375 RepID=A0A941ETS3_9ACTN|nr:ABC transporter family substrate-binding protein [Actinospica durhamensis]MBR7834939.1 ABC transporter family substrate-binding protein [Actinospica durhamensis]